jgi:hypothetical protein
MNINMLCPMIEPTSKKLLLMDFSSGKTYELKTENDSVTLSELPQDFSEGCFANIREQQEELTPEIPIEEIYKVLNTEKKVAEENNKHIFRRGS